MAEPLFRNPEWFRSYAHTNTPGPARRIFVRDTEEESKKGEKGPTTFGEVFQKGNVFGIADALFANQIKKPVGGDNVLSMASKGMLTGVFIGGMLMITYIGAHYARIAFNRLGL